MAQRILVVEDSAQNRMLLKDLLEFHGIEVLEAANGEEGVAAARKEMPDLILMDLQMPVLDGLAAGKTLKENPCHLAHFSDPILFHVSFRPVEHFIERKRKKRIICVGSSSVSIIK